MQPLGVQNSHVFNSLDILFWLQSVANQTDAVFFSQNVCHIHLCTLTNFKYLLILIYEYNSICSKTLEHFYIIPLYPDSDRVPQCSFFTCGVAHLQYDSQNHWLLSYWPFPAVQKKFCWQECPAEECPAETVPPFMVSGNHGMAGSHEAGCFVNITVI